VGAGKLARADRCDRGAERLDVDCLGGNDGDTIIFEQSEAAGVLGFGKGALSVP
jgi:hypothetical protein